MSVSIVCFLKVVDVKHKGGKRQIVSIGFRNLFVKMALQVTAVVETGQGVGDVFLFHDGHTPNIKGGLQ